MSDPRRFYVALKGVIWQNNKFLIIKRSDKTRGEHGLWEFPGGRMEFGEIIGGTLYGKAKSTSNHPSRG